MKLPPDTAGYEQRVHCGRYVTTRLRQASFNDLALGVEQATAKVKAAGRALDDAAEPVQIAIALRDAADAAMDESTRDFRLKRASRSLSAAKESPYTRIFPEGVGYYVAAPVDVNESRYKELIARVQANLPENDALRGTIVSAITAGVEQYAQALTQVRNARTALALARTECDAAAEDWTTLMEKTYGALISEVGKKAADRYFPRPRRGGPGTDAEE